MDAQDDAARFRRGRDGVDLDDGGLPHGALKVVGDALFKHIHAKPEPETIALVTTRCILLMSFAMRST